MVRPSERDSVTERRGPWCVGGTPGGRLRVLRCTWGVRRCEVVLRRTTGTPTTGETETAQTQLRRLRPARDAGFGRYTSYWRMFSTNAAILSHAASISSPTDAHKWTCGPFPSRRRSTFFPAACSSERTVPPCFVELTGDLGQRVAGQPCTLLNDGRS
eukprot:2475763-Prymnesium_polylepis.3